jgi:hypothetical protein
MKPALLPRALAGPRTNLLFPAALRPAAVPSLMQRSRHGVTVQHHQATWQVRVLSTAKSVGLLLLVLLLLLLLPYSVSSS